MKSNLSGTNSSGQSRPGSKSNEELFHVPEIPKAGESSSDSIMSNPGHSLVGALAFCCDAVCILQPQLTEFGKGMKSLIHSAIG